MLEVLGPNSWFEKDLDTLQGTEWRETKGIEQDSVIGLTRRCILAEKSQTQLGFVNAIGKIQLAAKV